MLFKNSWFLLTEEHLLYMEMQPLIQPYGLNLAFFSGAMSTYHAFSLEHHCIFHSCASKNALVGSLNGKIEGKYENKCMHFKYLH